MGDVDFFSVHKDESTNYRNSWMDFYQVSQKEFVKKIKVLDLSITDPMIQGELICGNRTQYEKAIQQINTQPITREAIEHNLKRSYEQETISKQLPQDSPEQQTAQGYANSFRANAQQLSQGHKALTLAKLEEIYGRLRK